MVVADWGTLAWQPANTAYPTAAGYYGEVKQTAACPGFRYDGGGMIVVDD